jgi:hypothetical protein
MSFDVFSTPQVNQDATKKFEVVPNKAQIQEQKIKEAFHGCATMTKQSLEMLLSPEFSFLIQGAKLASNNNRFETGLGIMMIMASPVFAIVKVGIAVPGAVIGAVGTAATGIAYGVEKGINKIQNDPHTLEAQSQRVHLTQLFVDRLKTMLEKLPYVHQYDLMKNPGLLINMGAISLAFLSRNESESRLKVGDEFLNVKDIEGQDKTRKKYFVLICEMKHAIRSLNLSPDDEHAWNYLIKLLNEAHADSGSSADKNELATCKFVLQHVSELTSDIVKDSVFNELWKKSYPDIH